MTGNPMDTHAMVKNLLAAGFTEQQAEAQVTNLTSLVTYNLATKADVAAIHRDVEQLRKDLKTDIAAIHRDIEQLRKDTRTDIELGRREVKIVVLLATMTLIGAFKYL